MDLIHVIAGLVVFFGIINLFRMSLFLIGSDIYNLRKYLASRKQDPFQPTVSVVIPAHNEEKSIVQAVSSALISDYPQEKIEVIVVNDGSIDDTLDVLSTYLMQSPARNVRVISQVNQGKAHALNTGMKQYATGELVMCLDADSFLDKQAIKKAVSYFTNPQIMAVAANVKITRTKGLLNLIQMFEYIVSYQMKRAQTLFNIEYIIGGIGSTFRRSFLESIYFYDANTVTEDIDITMKILQHGNKTLRVIYGSDIIVYTQGVLTIKDLMRQRHRWKWGRYQTFLKNKTMFFPRDKKFTKGLTWFYLPFALFSDLTFLCEPLIVGYIVYIVIFYRDVFTLVSAFLSVSFYVIMNILAEETIAAKNKTKLILIAPFMYVLFYVLSFVEYVALIKSLFTIHTLRKSISQNKCSWESVARAEFSSPYFIKAFS